MKFNNFLDSILASNLSRISIMEPSRIDLFLLFYVQKIARKFMKFGRKLEAIEFSHFLLFGNGEL